MENSRQKNGREDYKIAALIIAALVVAFMISAFVARIDRIVGESMLPTLREKEWILTNRLAYYGRLPKYGDIVIFKKKDITDTLIVKRIIGTPGDVVEIRAGILYINQKKVNEEGVALDQTESSPPVAVPEECYFVLGDNRNYSKDSRHWDNPFVRRTELTGKVIFKCFPKFKGVQ